MKFFQKKPVTATKLPPHYKLLINRQKERLLWPGIDLFDCGEIDRKAANVPGRRIELRIEQPSVLTRMARIEAIVTAPGVAKVTYQTNCFLELVGSEIRFEEANIFNADGLQEVPPNADALFWFRIAERTRNKSLTPPKTDI